MGLPQSLVDMIFEYLKTDRDALLSCSLTCRALFCSARRVIHERLYVAGPRVSPPAGKLTEWRWFFNRRYLRILSLADDADLIQYTRHLIVEVGQTLTPRNLRPYIPTFQKYVWLTSLTLTHFDSTPFLPVFDRYFRHLSHSLRSLYLISPRGSPDVMTDFISQFRNLDNLGLNRVMKPPCRPQRRSTTSLGPRRWFTPLGGTLRIANTDSRRSSSLKPLLHLPGGLRFRSLEFVCCTDINTSGIIQRCSSTLESVACTLHCRESVSLVTQCRFSRSPLILALVALARGTFLEFDLGTCQGFRVFEARIENPSYTFDNLISWLTRVLGTITSPVFSKFILSLDQTTLEPHVLQINPPTTDILDQLLSWLTLRLGMRFIIKGEISLVWRQLLLLCFPSSTAVGGIMFDHADSGATLQCSRTR